MRLYIPSSGNEKAYQTNCPWCDGELEVRFKERESYVTNKWLARRVGQTSYGASAEEEPTFGRTGYAVAPSLELSRVLFEC